MSDLCELKDLVLSSARGSWVNILPVFGFDSQRLNGRGHPCPKCGGTDRFSFMNRDGNGSVFCRKCNNSGPTCMDGIGAVQWIEGCTFPEAIRKVAEYLGLSEENVVASTETMLNRVAKLKRVNPDFLKMYGASDAVRVDDKQNYPVIRFPLYGMVDCVVEGQKRRAIGEVSHFDLGMGTDRLRKGKAAYDRPAGVFLPHRYKTSESGMYRWAPNPEKPVYVVEGVKDAAKLFELGYTTIGMLASLIPQDFIHAMSGLVVYLVPDRDQAGDTAAQKNARMLWGIAKEIRIVRLPSPVKVKDGDGVREIVDRLGAEKVHEAIADARVWELPKVESSDMLTFSDSARLWFRNRAGRALRTWSTGIPCLDESIKGFNETEYIMFAGRPGRGKTAYACFLALEHVISGGVPIVFSQEMLEDEVGERLMQRALGKDRDELRERITSDPDGMLADIESLSQFDNLLIVRKQKDIQSIIAMAESAVATHGVTMMFLDYVQIVRAGGRDEREQLNEVSAALRDFAKKNAVTVIALSQLNRNADQEGRPISMSDLKGSGALEQDPDTVIAINWPGVDDDGDYSPCEFHCLKSRNNGIKKKLVKAAFDPRFYYFGNQSPKIHENYF